jgi:UDP-N-acetylglucosamine 3-dehydrogenase
MKKLRVGLIGLGGVAEMHLMGYKEAEQIDVVAGAELVKDRLNQMVQKWGFKGYSDYEEMLKKEDLDVACVLTPARYHREITEKVAEHGVNILCEKPMALTLEEAKSMITKCKKEGVKLCYGSTYRFLPACRKAKETIAQGALGDLFLVMEIQVGGQGLKGFRPLGFHHYPEGGPGGGGMGLIDHGIHLVDIFRWYTGSEVESVYGRGNISGQAPSTEYLTVVFKNKVVGQLLYNEATFESDMPCEGIFSWGMGWGVTGEIIQGSSWEPHPGNIRVYGTDGTLRIFFYANKLFFFGKGRQQEIRVLDKPCPGNFGMQIDSFANRLLRDEDPEVTGADGLKALQVILAAYESYKTKRAISI